MKVNMNEYIDHSVLATSVFWKHAVLAVSGGIAHAINAQRNGQTKNWMDFILLALMSSFFGVLFGLIALSVIGEDEYLTLAIAGAGGWLGIEGAGMLIDFLKRALKIQS